MRVGEIKHRLSAKAVPGGQVVDLARETPIPQIYGTSGPRSVNPDLRPDIPTRLSFGARDSLKSVDMAGTLIYRLQVDHVYQRRFGQAELAEALKSSHWYIVTRRPSVRIVEGSAALDDQILTVDLTTGNDLESPRSVHTLGLDFGQFESLTDFRTYAHGAYFSVEVDGRLAHGDAWALASLLSNADTELAAQEVLYVGEAFGKNGSSNVWRRVRAHEKLQQIYEDHADFDCDIFVAPLSLERRAWTSGDHIDDDDSGPSVEQYYQHFANEQGGICKASVDLIEHSLISYFTPHYNERLTQWRQETPTKSMRLMRDAGFRLIQVHLSGWWGLARFHSTAVPSRFRSHLISQDLPLAPRPPAFRGAAAEQLGNWQHIAMMVHEGQDLLEEAAARTGVTIRVFGECAPTLRTPPGVLLPAVPPLAEDTRAARDALRADVAERREEYRRATAPTMHPGKSTYDPETGTIAFGARPDGTVERRRLHDPSTGKVNSTVVFGDARTGQSNHLRVLLVEALMTGLFVPAIADVAAKGELREWFGANEENGFFVEGVNESVKLLEALCRVIDYRTAARNYRKLSREVPAILLGVDNADALVHNERGASLIGRILTEGGAVGIGAVLVLDDITTFEGNPELMRNLVTADYKASYTPYGRSVLRYLDAKYGLARSRTWGEDDTPLFVVHQDEDNAVLGFAVAWLDAGADEASAKGWAVENLRQLRGVPIDQWRQVNEDPGSWWTVDIQRTRWFLRRHHDVWLLVKAETNMPGLGGPELIEWAEGQIEARYEVELGQWRIGPGTGTAGTAVFYIEANGEIISKDQSGSIKRRIAGLY